MEKTKKLQEILTCDTNLSAADATAQLSEALGLDDEGVYKLFPALRNWKHSVILMVHDYKEYQLSVTCRDYSEHEIGCDDHWYTYNIEHGWIVDNADEGLGDF